MDYHKLLKDFKGNTILIPFLESVRGMGKTKTVKDYAKSENLPLTILNLAAIEAADFTGRPYIENGVTVYAKPEFLNMKKGVLFLDEINRVSDSDVKAALLSLIVDRQVNGHKLSDAVQIIGAGNPDSDEYDTYELDAALQDRVVKIEFAYTLKEFFNYIKDKTPFLDFLMDNQQVMTDLSRRRIEEGNKMYHVTQDAMYIELFFGQEIASLFNNYMSKRLFGLNDILAGKKSKDSVGIQTALNDLASFMLSGKQIEQSQAQNANAFLHGLSAENKLVFFGKLKDLNAELDAENMEKIVDNLKTSGIFKGLGKYFKEVF